MRKMLLVLLLVALPMFSHAGEQEERGFSGQWHLELCDKRVSEQCGGFTVYLVQTGKKICGDHFFVTPGLGRLNEGAPRSIIGTITGNVADIVITSGRNGTVFRVRAMVKDDVLRWEIVEEVERGAEGDSALVLDKGSLKRVIENSEYQTALSACENQ